ncbi:MAG: hypothetical protein JF628_16110 [Sphingomonas sp.]|nr:hypothetical protein [Sphingomonas sp.]
MLMEMSERQIESADPILGARFPATVRPLFIALACMAGLVASDPALARDYGSRNVRGWTVAVSKDGEGCFLTRDFERGTTLLLGLDTDGTNRLSVLNPKWSIKPRDKLTLNFRLSNSSYPAHFAVGMVSEEKQGFVTSFGAKFPSYFATSKTLFISRGDIPVERLDLDGADAAVAALRHCVDDQRSKPAPSVAGEAQPDEIPRDPFAPAPVRDRKD